MLIRRMLSTSFTSSTSTCLRSLSTSAARRRVPALADITPNNAPSFDQRQIEFRQRVKEAQQEKAKQDSQSARTPTSPGAAEAPDTAAGQSGSGSGQRSSGHGGSDSNDIGIAGVGLGSLTTHSVTEAAREPPHASESIKRKGKLASLIYGTHEGQQMDHEIEKSFSQVLARGKYLHSIVFHTVKPDKVDEYVDLIGGWYPRVAGMEENHVHLVGSWRTEVGDCDTFGLISPMSPRTVWPVGQTLTDNALVRSKQFIYGNISATTATTPLSTASPRTLTSLPLTRSSSL